MDSLDQLEKIAEKIEKTCSRPVTSSKMNDFFNPGVMKGITCLLKTMPERGSLNSRIQFLFRSLREPVPEILSIRGPGNEDDLINEAFIGIVYLNDLRGANPSFKYIFNYLDGQIIEETMNSFPRLEDFLRGMSSSDERFASLYHQILAAVGMAEKHGVVDLPLEIRVRPTDIQNVNGLPTLGYIPVFTRFYSARISEELNNTEEAKVSSHLLSLVSPPPLPPIPEVQRMSYRTSLMKRIWELTRVLTLGSPNSPVTYLTWAVYWEYIRLFEENGSGMNDFVDLARSTNPSPGKIELQKIKYNLDRVIPNLKSILGKSLNDYLPSRDCEELKDISDFETLLIGLRDVIRDQTYLRTSQAMVKAYQRIASYPNLSNENSLQEIREYLIQVLRRKEPSFQIQSLRDATTLSLYSSLISPLSENLDKSYPHAVSLTFDPVPLLTE